MKLLLLGPQGAGKSTQARLLSEYLHIPAISTGDIFRQISKETSKDAKRIAQIVKSGELVPDKEVSELVEKRLQQDDCANGFILDGYPRSMTQIEYFDPCFDKVILLVISKEKAIERLLKRGRFDDTPESIQTRLENYYLQIEDIVSFYHNKGKVVKIEAQGSIEDIQNSIKNKIGLT